ncbi:uncharacterized protein At4g00950-like [Solanum stenotomum]|uniref:uncharacterized protein At4g00950-like n=1 Tax=Solanum stenotomum TaxID=172797 RepID=UPI0020D05194|nr:uncharacterized protein At4g00950-like [Solanum stenotomum]
MEASDPKPKSKPEPIIPKFPLFYPKKEIPNITSPVHHTIAASVPFQWEKEPGKPNTINLPINKPKSLEPPPRLYSINTPSPTTVLDGPYYNNNNNNNKISSSSFRFFKNISKTPETEQFVKKGNWWQRNVKRKIGSNNSSVFLSSMDSTGKSCSARMGSFRRNGSSSNLYATKSNMMWANIYEGFKKAIPWKSNKSKNCSSYSFQHQQSI